MLGTSSHASAAARGFEQLLVPLPTGPTLIFVGIGSAEQVRRHGASHLAFLLLSGSVLSILGRCKDVALCAEELELGLEMIIT